MFDGKPKNRRTLHLCVGGPVRVMPMPSGKSVTFEMHSYCGPMFLKSDGFTPRQTMLPESSKFWPRFERWLNEGEQVDAFGRCQFNQPPTSGTEP